MHGLSRSTSDTDQQFFIQTPLCTSASRRIFHPIKRSPESEVSSVSSRFVVQIRTHIYRTEKDTDCVKRLLCGSALIVWWWHHNTGLSRHSDVLSMWLRGRLWTECDALVSQSHGRVTRAETIPEPNTTRGRRLYHLSNSALTRLQKTERDASHSARNVHADPTPE